ncbi:conserved hypothetical protein [Enterobacterales bacterium 8AC]|nr:conserved hypothetical protein [Enterobacterales bacterium 8AC]
MLDFLNISSTKSLLRDYYTTSEAAKIIGCDEKDIFWFAANDRVELCYELESDRFQLFAKLDKKFTDSIRRLKSNQEGYYQVSESSFLKVVDNNSDSDDRLLLNLTGLWAINKEYKNKIKVGEGDCEYYPELLIPVGNSYVSPDFLPIVDAERSHEFSIADLLMTKSAIGQFLDAVAEDKSESKGNYQSQSDAQKLRHALPQNEVLMAVIYLYHQDMKLRKENATEIANVLFDRAEEFWPESQTPPLGYDTVVSLLRKVLKKGVFTKN